MLRFFRFFSLGYRQDSFWWRATGGGPDYIERAFRAARAAAPTAKLFLNDYSVAEKNRKSDDMYALVKDFKARKVPIDGVGFQLHISHNIDMASVASNMARFAALGVKISFTEVDVFHRNRDDPSFPDDQARIYGNVAQLFAESDDTLSFLTWGVHDPSSWIPEFFGSHKGDALLIDEDFEPKLAYSAVERGFKI